VSNPFVAAYREAVTGQLPELLGTSGNRTVLEDGPPKECCPHCGARLERGDDGNCNRCGEPWPLQERDFSDERRAKLADKGVALPDGSFPILTAKDLANAVRLYGRAKDPAAARAHIKQRATALDLEDELPETWREGRRRER
jgi:hypothetical protein